MVVRLPDKIGAAQADASDRLLSGALSSRWLSLRTDSNKNRRKCEKQSIAEYAYALSNTTGTVKVIHAYC